jgi:hypothetical protein
MRLAAKEAVLRTLVRGSSGQGRRLTLRGAARERWRRLGLGPCRLSLSCRDGIAMAVVVWTSPGRVDT